MVDGLMIIYGILFILIVVAILMGRSNNPKLPRIEYYAYRVFLTITILSFIISFGSCVSCFSMQDGRVDGVITRGVGSEEERTVGIVMISSIGISFLSGIIALIFWAGQEEYAKARKKNKKNKGKEKFKT